MSKPRFDDDDYTYSSSSYKKKDRRSKRQAAQRNNAEQVYFETFGETIADSARAKREEEKKRARVARRYEDED